MIFWHFLQLYWLFYYFIIFCCNYREVFRPTTLNVGPFKIISSTGKVDPGKIQRIKIYSIPNDVKEYNETVMFILKDGSAQHKRGKPIYLTCAGSVPNISLEDLQYIFQEVYIVETYDGTNEIKQVIFKTFFLSASVFI